jgi:drug/metabolite transporter (DMT)-like permease
MGAGVIVVYGVLAVASAQLCYFLAVARLDVGVALLIEYTAPIAVVGWLWMRHGNKPSRVTVLGAAIAAVGLVLLLNVIGEGSIDLVGVAWALGAMVGAAAYFVMGSDQSNGLPPLALASGGVAVAAVVLIAAVLAGVLPFEVARGSVEFEGFAAPWWAVALVLGAVTAGLSYVAGIAATRVLGARLASFVSLIEVIAAATFAWLLLGQTPLPIQLGGAALVLVGVIVVKVGEPKVADEAVEPIPVLATVSAPR